MNTNAKIIDWFKNNWISLLVVCLIGALAFIAWRQFSLLQSSTTQLVNEKYIEQAASFKQQLKHLEEVYNERFQKLEQLNKEYEKELQRIDSEYKEQLKIVSRNQRKNQVQIIEEATKDPNTLLDKIEKTFGIPKKEIEK